MPKITIRLDDDTATRLRGHLQLNGASLSDLVRSAVRRELDRRSSTSPYGTWLKVQARCVGSGETDLSTTYKRRIREKLRAKHRR